MREMKDSGVEWIGEIPVSWQILTIGSVFKVRNEKVNDTDYPPLSVAKGGVVPQMENVAKSDANDNRKMVLSNDFVINSRSDRKQSCGVSPMDGSVSLINTVLYPANGAPVIPAYLNYLLKNYGFAEEFYRWGHGIVADLWTTRWQEMKSILLPIPSMGEQQQILEAISEKTDKVDTLIANVKAQIEKLKAYRQSVITEVVIKGLDPTVPMKDSGVEWIGEIPAAWDTVRVKQLLRERKERSAEGKEEPLSMSQKVGLVPTKTLDAIPNPASSYVGAKLAFVNDLVFNKLKAHLGVFSVSKYDGLVSPDYAVYYSTGVVDLKYLEYLFKTPQCISEFSKRSTGIAAGLTRLYTDGLFAIECPLPPKDEQQAIVAYLDEKWTQIDRLIAIKQAKIEKLEQYKRSLIYEYVTGKREVV
jgi:type I restriction enzyme S subunit